MPLSAHTHPLQPAVSVWMLINFSEISTGLLIVSEPLIVSFPLARSAPLILCSRRVRSLSSSYCTCFVTFISIDWILFDFLPFNFLPFALVSSSCLSFPLVHPLMSSILLYFLLCLLSFSRFHGLQLLPCPLLLLLLFQFHPVVSFLVHLNPRPYPPFIFSRFSTPVHLFFVPSSLSSALNLHPKTGERRCNLPPFSHTLFLGSGIQM